MRAELGWRTSARRVRALLKHQAGGFGYEAASAGRQSLQWKQGKKDATYTLYTNPEPKQLEYAFFDGPASNSSRVDFADDRFRNF